MLLSLYQVQNSHILLLHNYYRKKKNSNNVFKNYFEADSEISRTSKMNFLQK